MIEKKVHEHDVFKQQMRKQLLEIADVNLKLRYNFSGWGSAMRRKFFQNRESIIEDIEEFDLDVHELS